MRVSDSDKKKQVGWWIEEGKTREGVGEGRGERGDTTPCMRTRGGPSVRVSRVLRWMPSPHGMCFFSKGTVSSAKSTAQRGRKRERERVCVCVCV